MSGLLDSIPSPTVGLIRGVARGAGGAIAILIRKSYFPIEIMVLLDAG